MAKKSDPKAEQELFLKGLLEAFDGEPRLLQGTADKKALYPGGAKGAGLAKRALDEGYLERSDPPAGTKATKTQTYVRLSAKGRQFIEEQDDPKSVLEGLLPVVKDLSGKIEEIRRELMARVQSMADMLQRTTSTMEKVLSRPRTATVQPRREEPPAPSTVQPPPTATRQPEPAGPQAVGPRPGAPRLEESIRQAYDKLRHFVEYQDGLVEIPHLYDEVRQTTPGVTLDEFKEKVKSLWNERKVELHILNEVHKAREPEKAITRSDSLYYYLIWK